MDQWTSEYAILRDLSVAQGRVPVAIERTVGAGDKPPSLNITEETEEEFFKHCSADANVSATPDLGLIQKMLDMVRDVNDWSDNEDLDRNSNNQIVITKLNPKLPEFIPSQKNTSTPTNFSPTKLTEEKPKKRQRNIAVESILQANAENRQINEVILRKPDDFIKVEKKFEPDEKQVFKESHAFKEISGGEKSISSTPTLTEKVNGWFETHTGSPFPKKPTKVTLEATNIVFKKKEKKKVIEKCPKENLKRLEKSPISSSNSGEFKPSTLANEYYLKYVQNSKFKESVKEDIWTKAERKMKDIDEKRRSEAAQASASPSTASPASRLNLSFEETQSTDTFTARVIAETKISHCLDLVALSQHRHHLTGDCIVCEVLRKKPEMPKTDVIGANNDNEVINSTDNVEFDNAICITEEENACFIEFEHQKKNTEKEEEIKNKVDPAKLNDSVETLTENLQIEDFINNELAKFVENPDLNNKKPRCLESPDFELCVENEHSNNDAVLDVENVYECVSKNHLLFEEGCLLDRSF